MRFLATLLLVLWAALPARAEIDIQDVRTPGGLTAWLVEDHNIPFVALEIRFRGGASLDLPGKRGATNLMTGLLEEGAGDLDARAFAEAVESQAASFGFSAGDDSLSVSARFLTENREAAMDLLRLALTKPRFDADAVERVRAQVLSSLRSDAKDPNQIAGRAFDAMVFGDHPYGSNHRGSIDSVSALTRDDLVAAKDNAMARDRIYVSAVGDITADELATLLDDLLADLPPTGAPLPGPAELQFAGGIKVVPFDTPQSVTLWGQPGIGFDDPDFFAAYVMNTVLGGGGFDSRLMTEVREKRGLTYGIWSYTVDKDLADLMMGQVASANDRMAETIAVIREEWQRMAEQGVTQEELDQAKTYLTGAYPLRFDGNARIANILAGMQMDGMAIDYAATRNDRINAVTLADVREVAARLLDPEALTFVVVGAPAGL